jgi:hypothetical protein
MEGGLMTKISFYNGLVNTKRKYFWVQTQYEN